MYQPASFAQKALFLRRMIAYLNGALTHKSPSLLHVEVHGVGYEVQISLNTWASVEKLDSVKLLIHQQFREDGQTLYGFFDAAEKAMFLQLIGISGVGAGTARMMLSALRPDEVAQAILQGDSKALERVKGIGRKTAERIVLELRDKVQKPDIALARAASPGDTAEQDSLQALVALGIPRATAEAAVRKAMAAMPGERNLEVIIKKTLQLI
jgi:Holliday junction DNA helicase RuvA